jgi:hypothetical protein
MALNCCYGWGTLRVRLVVLIASLIAVLLIFSLRPGSDERPHSPPPCHKQHKGPLRARPFRAARIGHSRSKRDPSLAERARSVGGARVDLRNSKPVAIKQRTSGSSAYFELELLIRWEADDSLWLRERNQRFSSEASGEPSWAKQQPGRDAVRCH